MQKHKILLFSLLAATLDHKIDRCLPLLPVDDITWTKLFDLAGKHGVLSLMLATVEQLPVDRMPQMKELKNLFAQAVYQRHSYLKHFMTAQKFATALKAKGVEMKILKGISFSTYYDQPEQRVFQDCDCYLSVAGADSDAKVGASGFEIGNSTIAEIGGKYRFGTYKHSHLFLNGMMFENHRYITDFNGTKRGKRLELLLERALASAPGTIIEGSDMVRPCVYFNALHLIRHAQGNFMSGDMNLRMLYDWAVLLRAEQNNLDWGKLYADLDICGLSEFASVITSICVDYFDLKVTCGELPVCKDKALVENVLSDIVSDSMPIKTADESLAHKALRIAARFKRFWHFRRLSIEPVPIMILNSFLFSSYLKRKINFN